MDLPVVAGQIVAKKYRVDRQIGAGGMGVVAAAHHLELDQPVAIKFLNPQLGMTEEALERFRREARAAAKIHSEHVARVLDIGLLDDQTPYMVMELLDGNDLCQELAKRGPLPFGEAVDCILQAIDAIAEAHAAGIVHRDLKPSNLFRACQRDGTRIIKVLDFGISKLIGASEAPTAALTQTASFVGSPLYTSPEQLCSARDVDARADIWSLGAILYELLTGQTPYSGESMPQLCVAVLNEAPQSIRTLVPSAPESLQAVLWRCMAKDRADRFASVADLAEALVPFAPWARARAERARRLLGPSSPDTLDVVRASGASRPPPTTQESWGRTGQPSVSKPKGPSLLLGALLIALAVGAWSFGRRLVASDSEAGASGSIGVPLSPHVAAAAPVTEHAPTPALPSSLPPTPSATLEPELAKAPVPAASAESAKSIAEPRVRVPSKAFARPPVARPTENPSTASRGSSPLVTDFGGRR